MKRLSAFICAMFISTSVFAAGSTAVPDPNDTDERYVYNNTVLEIPGTGAPYESDKSVVFTAKADARFTGIAFDFEGYKTIHPFRIRKTRDADGKVTGSLMFYILDRPKYIQSVSYRLIVDGLWTTDPLNPDRYYDENTGILLSRFTFSSTTPPETVVTKENTVRFIYKGTAEQNIYLAGTFTNWDPWIYEMNETSPGFYELSLPLPAGTYYYNYYAGMKAFTDKTNPKKVYTDDGRIASVITVK
ncbi:MAG: glycogen-binding domain-containing protein [Treponema sp.]